MSRKGSPLWTRRGKVIKDHVAHADNVLRTLDYQHELCLVFTVASIPSRLSATNRRIGVVLSLFGCRVESLPPLRRALSATLLQCWRRRALFGRRRALLYMKFVVCFWKTQNSTKACNAVNFLQPVTATGASAVLGRRLISAAPPEQPTAFQGMPAMHLRRAQPSPPLRRAPPRTLPHSQRIPSRAGIASPQGFLDTSYRRRCVLSPAPMPPPPSAWQAPTAQPA